MPEQIRRIRLTPTEQYLKNPHKGCCTFQRFNGDALYSSAQWSEEGPTVFPPPVKSVAWPRTGDQPTIDGYLPSTVSYCRWFWKILEPKQGTYDFSMIDQALKTSRERGQTLAVRLMAFGSLHQPQLPDWYLAKYPLRPVKYKSAEQKVPDHDSDEYFQLWGGLIREFAKKYDGHPQLESIDLAFIGPWGEGAGEATPATAEKFSALWKEAFPKTLRIAQAVDNQLIQGIQSGAGWRHDCFGDMKDWGTSTVPKLSAWNHHFDDYPRLIQGIVKDVWKTAPVHLESCWVPSFWHEQDWDIDFILEQGLKYHATYFMPKSTAIPHELLPKLSKFCRRLGYRYILRQVVIDRETPVQEKFKMIFWIENVGVAPLYRRYDFSVRLRQDDKEVILPFKDVDVRTWASGDEWIQREIQVPPGFRPGVVDLAVGLTDPESKEARVSFAVKEQFSDRWVDLGGIELR